VESEKDYQKVFAVYDRKKRGRFDFNDYESVWAGNKQKFPIQTLQEAFELMDTNSDGFVNFQEFIKAMRRE
jgi:Ca2+-binding EF-hand superfamily protein